MINRSVPYINKKISLPLFLFFIFLSPFPLFPFFLFPSFSFCSSLPHISFFPRHHFPPPGHSILHNIYPCTNFTLRMSQPYSISTHMGPIDPDAKTESGCRKILKSSRCCWTQKKTAVDRIWMKKPL